MSDETKFDLTYICLGAGVQSTALLLMSNKGLYGVPKAEVAVFADTMTEPPWVYDHLEKLKELSDIPIHTVSAGNLKDDSLYGKPGLNRYGKPYSKFVTIPVYSQNEDGSGTSLLRRQCTREYKIAPLERFIRKHLGYKPRQRIKESACALMGISVEEASRMKPSRTRWVTNEYPLVDARIDRNKCHRVIEEHGWPRTQKSSCTLCPFHSDSWFKDLKEKHPDLWDEVVEFDREIRFLSRKGEERTVFIHKSCKPIDEVDFTHGGQLEFGFINGCDEGHCGV